MSDWILSVHFPDTTLIFSRCLSQSQHMTFTLASCTSLPSRNWAPKPWVKRVVEKWALLSQLHEHQVWFCFARVYADSNQGPTWPEILQQHNPSLRELEQPGAVWALHVGQDKTNLEMSFFFVGIHTEQLMVAPLLWEIEDLLCMMDVLYIWLNCPGLSSTVRRPIIWIKGLNSVQYTIMMSEQTKRYSQSSTWLL